MTARPEAAAAFRALHAGPDMLVLPNAWDAVSARLIETLGARAIATTSAGVAWSHGYADGHHLPLDVAVSTVREIVRVVNAPVTTDIEGGFADDPAGAGEAAARMIDAGAAGINIEDGAGAPEVLCRKIEAVRAAADRAGVALFVNARCDVYLRKLVDDGAALAETLRRGHLYREAGADGFFVPLAPYGAAMGLMVGEVGLTFNAIVHPGQASRADLQAMGVRRFSAGTAIARSAFEALSVAAAQFLADGNSDALVARAGDLANLNVVFGPV